MVFRLPDESTSSLLWSIQLPQPHMWKIMNSENYNILHHNTSSNLRFWKISSCYTMGCPVKWAWTWMSTRELDCVDCDVWMFIKKKLQQKRHDELAWNLADAAVTAAVLATRMTALSTCFVSIRQSFIKFWNWFIITNFVKDCIVCLVKVRELTLTFLLILFPLQRGGRRFHGDHRWVLLA